ncbi:unnamed protein product [Caenorhabditis bovis]|uniref:Cadherin domain-containing protein n=1 Tax=Caenorhabditis bovis TaxID=2654633 RepID=A0A8S1EHE5_9PELO|nr:unnamed protein product [Caenorhabditis bovis]
MKHKRNLESARKRESELDEVAATNRECGYSKRIRFGISPPADQFLSIDSISGTVCISKQFDYETTKSFQATVTATNSNAESSTSLIAIKLTDVNDNWPVFYPNEYQLTVREGAMPTEALLVVSATDDDDGLLGDVAYQIVSESRSFAIDSKSGEIFAKRDLTKGRYHLVVSAKDGQGLAAEYPANVHITVVGPEARTPEFSRTKYVIRTTEDILPGIAIGSVAAVSEGRIRYSIYSGDPQHQFSIDEESGKIFVTRDLDADAQDSILLNVQATIDGGFSNQTQVLVVIDDHNDNPPVFANSMIEITVGEDTVVDEPFYVVQASDKDKKNNGRITYSIISTHPTSAIAIDSISGQITTRKPFDYESVRDFRVRIRAQDGGIPPKSSNMTLFVHIADVNDNSPAFDRKTYRMEIVENSPPKSLVGRVIASDLDSHENGHVVYRITNGSEYFGIDEKLGTIYTKRSLDREVISHVDITVSAHDRGSPPRSSSVDVRVDVLDVNDNPPSCQSITPIVVPENAPPSLAIGTIVASDPDKGQNGSVLYRAQLQHSLFVVKANGDVYLRRQLNASDEQLQRLSVIVSDQGTPKKSTVCHVGVRVAKGASNIRLYEPIPRMVAIPSECVAGCRLAFINATGVATWQIQSSEISNHFSLRDGVVAMMSLPAHRPPYSLVVVLSDSQGRQKSLHLRITSDSSAARDEVFRIAETTSIGSKIGRLGERLLDAFYRRVDECPLELDETSGALYLADGIRSSRRADNYSCTFEKYNTTDGSVEEMRVDLEVARARNDKPAFDDEQVTLSIGEDTLPGSIIFTANATSVEDGPISYRFAGAVENFAIDQFTGDVSLVDALDYRKKAQYHIVIEAFTTSRPTSMLLTLNVEESLGVRVPRIISPPLILISAEVRKGAIVHRVIADGAASYEINSDDSGFEIDSATGEINVVKTTEVSSEIVVRARNADKFDEQIVAIRTINDTSANHWHFFEQQQLKVEMKASPAAKNQPIASFLWRGAELSLVPKNDAMFELKDGYLIAKSDNIPPQSYHLTVLAESEDGGEFDWCQVEIKVTSSENTAKLASGSCGAMTIEENADYHGPIKRVIASGATPNATFRFQGVKDEFTIDAKTGEIFAKALDRERAQEHLLVVILTDTLGNDSCTIRVSVADVNDNRPIFDDVPQQLEINETAQVGDVIYRFSASDKDIGNNGKISFELLDDPSQSLDVIPETGALVFRRSSSNEMKAWNIRVKAFDHGNPSQSSDQVIQIVSRASRAASPPTFLRQSYLASVDEGMPRGQFVAKLESSLAEDHGITYSIVEGNVDAAFNIDSDGIIRTNLELDHEIYERYNLKVIGIGKQQISTRIDVKVNNLNDNIPSFPVFHQRKMSEAARIGSFVASIAAKDVDQLAPLQYFLHEPDEKFHLDRFTGVVHLIDALDYETKKEHVLKLRVTDGMFDTYSNLTISVIDVNDNPPVFGKPMYEIRVAKHTFSSSVPVATIEAMDLDATSRIVYTVKPGDLLSIDGNGTLYLAEARDVVGTITASDGELTSHAPVVIRIVDDQKFEPIVFTRNVFRFKVFENSPIGMSIGNFSTENRERFYRILSPQAAKTFAIDRFGRILIEADVDRETRAFYEFHVETNNEKCRVEIEILDENDNSPKFAQGVVHVNLKDGMTHGQIIGSLIAHDPDAMENGRLTYRILTGNDYGIVSIHQDSGAIAFNEWNDAQLFEQPNATWRMIVEASDHGNPSLSSLATVIVSVKMSAWSGSAPFFVLPAYEIHVLEGTPMNTMVQKVRASNRLGLKNSGLMYSLKDHNGKLSIDVLTGEIKLKTHLDWESEPIHSMLLSVSDGNGRSAVVPLRLIVEPIDEFAPVFTQPAYTFKVPLSTEPGESIGQIRAIDEDGGVHGIVHYSILDRQSTVEIEKTSGVIYLRKSLENRRNLTIEQFNVAAFSGPLKQSKATVRLEIGPFESHSRLPKILEMRTVQFGIAILVLLVGVLIVTIGLCMCRSRRDGKASRSGGGGGGAIKVANVFSGPPKPQKQVYSVQTGEIRVLSGDIAASESMPSTTSSSDALRGGVARGSSRSQIDSGIDPDNISVSSSVTDYLVSLGVNANPIPPKIRQTCTYDSLKTASMNDYIYARVEDVLPPGPISLTNPHHHSLLRQPLYTSAHQKRAPVVPSFEPLTEIFNEIIEMKKDEEEQQRKRRKEYVQVEI